MLLYYCNFDIYYISIIIILALFIQTYINNIYFLFLLINSRMSDFCNQVVTIPQYNETCWFNTILMSLLYSQNSRKLLLNKMQTFDKTNKLLYIITKILKNHYIDAKKAQQFFEIYTPDVILSHIPDIDQETYEYMIYEGWFFNFFIAKFIENIGCNCIVIDYFMDKRRKNKLYAGISQSLHIYSYRDEKFVKYLYELDEIYHKIYNTRNPDYICINTWTAATRNRSVLVQIIFEDNRYIKKDIKLDSYGFDYSGIEELDDIIYFNGNTYILDSCIINNYNKDRIESGHAIAGITCKSNKYVYNSLIRNVNDNETKTSNALPCELMKFNWDVNEDINFCLNDKLCKLPYITSQRQEKRSKNWCFSFAKGDRTLIYVKQNKLVHSIDSNSSSSSS
jgi:hypothetical protein